MGFSGNHKEGFDYLPWTDSETVFLWDCKFACCSDEEQKDHAIRYPYAQALVHSRIPNDWYRGMDLVRGSSKSTSNINPNQKKKEMYLLAVGFFRSGDYTNSEELVHRCLEIKPNCRKSRFLKEVLAYRYKQGKKSSISVGPPVTSVEFVTSVLAATRYSSHPTWGIEEVPSWAHPITSSNKVCEKVLMVCHYFGMLGSTKQGYDFLPWTDPETVLLWDCKFACSSSEEQEDTIRYLYAWVLIHSRKSDDMYRGVNMLRGSVEGTDISPKQKKKEMYLLAVGHFRSRHYTESEKFVSMCLEINPNCRKSLFLKEVIAYRYKLEGKKSIIFDPPITSVEFVTGILEANSRSSHPTFRTENLKSKRDGTRSQTLLSKIWKVLLEFLEHLPAEHPPVLQKVSTQSKHPSEKTTPPMEQKVSTPKKQSKHPSEKTNPPMEQKVSTPKKQSKHPSEKTTPPPPMEGTEILCVGSFSAALGLVLYAYVVRPKLCS